MTQIQTDPDSKMTQIKKITQKWSSLSLLLSAVVKGDQSSIYSKLSAFIVVNNYYKGNFLKNSL